MANTPAGIIKIAKKYNIPICISGIIRSKDMTHTIIIKEIKTLNLEDNIEDILKLVNNKLGEFIYQYPEQWIWIHNRWGE